MFSTLRLIVSCTENKDLSFINCIFDLLSDPIVNEKLPWKLTTFIEVKEWLDEKKGGEIFPVRIKNTNEFIGFIGIVSADSNLNEPEIGYVISPKKWLNGYASELVEGMIKFLFQQDISKIHAYTSSINLGSQKVLINNGFIMHDNTIHRHQERMHFIRIKK